jgi:hypothetical protein
MHVYPDLPRDHFKNKLSHFAKYSQSYGPSSTPFLSGFPTVSGGKNEIVNNYPEKKFLIFQSTVGSQSGFTSDINIMLKIIILNLQN